MIPDNVNVTATRTVHLIRRACLGSCSPCHTETEAAGQTFRIKRSQPVVALTLHHKVRQGSYYTGESGGSFPASLETETLPQGHLGTFLLAKRMCRSTSLPTLSLLSTSPPPPPVVPKVCVGSEPEEKVDVRTYGEKSVQLCICIYVCMLTLS